MIPQPEAPAQILLAEADQAVATSAQRLLERRGYRVHLASDGDQALTRFDPQCRVVITCVSLPKRDGLSVMREIRQRSPNTPFILLTEASSMSSAMMGLKEGAFAYILKPIADYLQLTHAVEQALELERLRRNAASPSVPRGTPPAMPKIQNVGALDQLADTTSLAQPQAKILEQFLKSAAQTFGASKAVVLLTDASQNLQMVAGLGNDAQATAARDFIRAVGEEFAWRVAHERQPVILSSPNRKFMHVGAPLISRDRLIGVVIVYEFPAGGIDPERLTWLQAYAAQAAAAVELARLDEENERLAQFDPLTGVYRETFFLELAEREFRRSWRFNEPISVIHIQIEGISALWARSKESGEHAVRLMAEICRQSVRNIDLVARGKDDSFTLLLLMTGASGGQSVAERIIRAVSAIPTERMRDGERIFVSLGLTSYPHETCTSVMDLLEIARSAHRPTREPGQNVIEYA